MLKNYIKIAYRNLTKNKLFSFINIFGLALSMSVCLLVLMRIKDQLSYDTFHPNASNTYRIITQLTNKQGAEYRLATTPMPLATLLSKDYNFTDKIVRLYPFGLKTASAINKDLKIRSAFTDPAFFELFGFRLQSGNARSVLTAPNSIVLSSEIAANYFGSQNPVGQTLSFAEFGTFQVTGIFDNAKRKSHLFFDAYISMASVPVLERSGKLNPILEQWSNHTTGYTYLSLRKGTLKAQLSKAVSQTSLELMKSTKAEGKENFALKVQPLNDIILGEQLAYGLGNTGSREKVLAEIAISFVLLLSACFNYTNLSLARSLQRCKEVGIRKVSGAFRFQIFYQFIIESVFIAFLSLGVAYILFMLIVDYAPFGEMVPDDASIDAGLIGWFTVFTLFTGVLAGALPAWGLSAFKPVEVLKNLSNIKLFGSNGLRKTLIVVQFALSLIIIILTATVHKQFNYMATGDPGFNVKNIINISLQGADYKILSHQIAQLKGVETISATSTNLGRSASGTIRLKHAPDAQPIQMEFYDVDSAFIDNMKLQLIAGSTFTEKISGKENQVIVSDLARKILQFKSSAEAIGQQIWLEDSMQVQIAGVMKDFYYHGLETPYGPLILRNRSKEFNYLHIKAAAEHDKALMASIETLWKRTVPDKTFEATWLYDEIFERKSAPGHISTLGFLAIITITLACMGLLGMVVYNIETRKKEIGIRKVMGASVSAILSLLSKNFMRLVVIAGLIGLPVSYVLSYLFLNIFANRVSIGFGILAWSFVSILLLSLLIICSQVYKVAIDNPVKSLRTE